jgi:hypothetical protein
MLMGVAPAFDVLATYTEGLGEVLEDTAETGRSALDILRERESLERQLLQVQGDTAALRALELAALDESNQALQQQIWAIEKANAVTAERESLERRLLQTQGDTAALRALELAALDESNQALQQQIWAIEDAAQASREIAQLSGIAAGAISNMFREVIQTAESEMEAVQMVNVAAQQMLIDGLVNAAVTAISDTLYNAVMAPIFESMIPAIVGGSDVAAAAMAAGGVASGSASAAGGAAGGMAVAEGGYIAGSTLAGIVDQAISMINIMAEILGNEDFQAAMSQIGGAFGAIGGAMYTSPAITSSYRPPVFTSPGGGGGSVGSGRDDMLAEREQLERRLLELQGNIVELRRRELMELHPLNRALQQQIWAMEDAARVAQEREGLERQLLQVMGDTAALRALDLAALDESNRALQEHIWAVEQAMTLQNLYTQYLGRMPDAEGFEWWTEALNSGRTTLEQVAEHFREIARINQEREGLERRLLELQGNTAELRAQELAALDPSNRALQEMIYRLQDAQSEFGRLAQEMGQMMGVINRLISATGRVDLSRMIERAQLPAEAGPLLDAIYAIEDAQRAYDQLSSAIDAEKQRLSASYQQERSNLQARQTAERQALVQRQQGDVRALQERHAAQMKMITDEVNALRGLAQAVGRTDLIRQLELMSLEPIARGIQSAIYSLEDAGTAFGGLERSINAAIESAGESVANLRSVVNSLRSAISTVIGADQAMGDRLQRSAMAELSTMAIMTRLTGALPDASELERVLSQVGSGPGAEQFATREDMLRERYRILADLRTLAEATEGQLTTEEQALDALQGQLDTAREQLDVLRGIDNTMLSVEDAMTAFSQAITAAQLAVGAIDVDRVVGLQGQADALQRQHEQAQAAMDARHAQQLEAMDAQHTAQMQRMEAQHQAAMQRLDNQLKTARDQLDELMGIDSGIEDVEGALLNFEDALQAAIDATGAVDLDELTNLQLQFMQLQNQYEIEAIQALTTINSSVMGVTDAVRALLDLVAQGNLDGEVTVPAFASGGLHSGGMRLVGEAGPELEVTGPSRIHTAQQIVDSMRGSDAAAEIRALREEVKALRESNENAQYQIAKFSQQTAKQLQRWDGDGLPEAREEMA